MKKDYIPTIDAKDVERIAKREFANDVDEANAILSQYGQEEWQKERFRVRIAALYLAQGDMDELRAVVQSACRDFRDVLMWAEYPNYDESGDARVADAERYRDWLNKR